MSLVENNILLPPSIFQMPLRVVPTAWAQHIPFLFWLIEAQRPTTFVELGTHYGMSYCAACQAIKELNLPTSCHAIDTWQGDDQTGFYSERVFYDLKKYHDELYGGFSQLNRTNFDEAAEYFPDGSIDLLHIDGLHSYDAVKQDFELWLPKLSEKAFVLFHDINVRERNFGVYKLWSYLKENYMTFEFLHGHGLGVLSISDVVSGRLMPLFLREDCGDTIAGIRRIFSHLGNAVQTYCDQRPHIDMLIGREMLDDTYLRRFISSALPTLSEETAQDLTKSFEVARCRTLFELGEDKAALALRLSVLLSQQDRVKDAIKFAEFLIHLEPENPDWFAHLGHLRTKGNDLPGAERAMNEAFRLSPENQKIREWFEAYKLKIVGPLPWRVSTPSDGGH